MLTDGAITLRPPEPRDVDAITEACQDPEIQRWTGVPSPYHRVHAEGYLERVAQEELAGRWRAFIAVDAEDRVLGSFSVMELDRRPGYGEIGYWVAPWARRRGVAARAVTLLRDWCVSELGLDHIELLIDVGNPASRGVAERTGFRDTGERVAPPRQQELTRPTHAVYAWSPS